MSYGQVSIRRISHRHLVISSSCIKYLGLKERKLAENLNRIQTRAGTGAVFSLKAS